MKVLTCLCMIALGTTSLAQAKTCKINKLTYSSPSSFTSEEVQKLEIDVPYKNYRSIEVSGSTLTVGTYSKDDGVGGNTPLYIAAHAKDSDDALGSATGTFEGGMAYTYHVDSKTALEIQCW